MNPYSMYSGVAYATELIYTIDNLCQQKEYLEKLSRETRMKEGFRQSVAKNGVMSVAEMLKKTMLANISSDNPKSNRTVTP